MDLNFGSSILLSSRYIQRTRDFEISPFPVWKDQAYIDLVKKVAILLVGHQEDYSSSYAGSVMYIQGPNYLYKLSQKPGSLEALEW